MNRELETLIPDAPVATSTPVVLALLVTGVLLTTSGCALVGPTGASAPYPSTQQSQAMQTSDVVTSPEPEARAGQSSWSELTKSGREHLLFDRHTAAEQDLLAAFEIAKTYRVSDARRRASLGNLEKLAADYRIIGNTAAATRILQSVADATYELSEFDSPGLSGLMIDLGDLYLTLGKLGSAAMAFDRALALRIDKSGPDSATLIPIYQALSDTEIKLQQYDRALEHANRSMDLAQTHSAEGSAERVSAELQAASANRYAGNFVEAEAQFKSALEAQRELEPSTLTEAYAVNGLAFLLLETGRLKEALMNVDLALSILDDKGHTGIDRAMVLDTKAQILAAEGRTDSAGELFDEVMVAAMTASPEEQRILYESYETFLREQNRDSEALEIRRKIDRIDAGPGTGETAEPTLEDVDASQNTAEAEPSLPDVSSAAPTTLWD